MLHFSWLGGPDAVAGGAHAVIAALLCALVGALLHMRRLERRIDALRDYAAAERASLALLTAHLRNVAEARRSTLRVAARIVRAARVDLDGLSGLRMARARLDEAARELDPYDDDDDDPSLEH